VPPGETDDGEAVAVTDVDPVVPTAAAVADVVPVVDAVELAAGD
jgi:hypothetical protein